MEYGLRIGKKSIITEKSIFVENKYTQKIIGKVSVADKSHILEAVDAAKNAFQKDQLSPYDRYEILNNAAHLIKKRKEDISKLIVEEVGKTIKEARVEVDRAVQTMILSSEEAKRLGGELIPLSASPGSENKFGFYMRVPIGVVCAITPFNVPFNLSCHKLGPAIAAGNTVVWKPSSDTPLNAHILLDILLDAGLPAGYVNLITGSGTEVGDWLLEDDRIAKYTFTGSPKVGKKIKEKSGFRNVSLELGNNSPNIICEDADIGKAALLCAKWGVTNAGQACISAQRLYVQSSVQKEFTEKLIEEIEKFTIGDPMDEATGIGPLISQSEADRVKKWIDESIAWGGKVVTGGEKKERFIQPTVLTNVNSKMKVVCEEIFGPVLTIIPFESLDEAIVGANDSNYGLQSGIFTNSNKIALYAAKKLAAGGVIINDASTYRADLMPYGGIKNSGIGREGPQYAIEEMTEIKTIVMNLE